jgi:hypothetical protein
MKLFSIFIALLSIISCGSITTIGPNKLYCETLEGVADFSHDLENIKSRYNLTINGGEVISFRLLSPFGAPLAVLRFHNSSLSEVIVRGNQVNEELLRSYLQDYGIMLPSLNYLPYWMLGRQRDENFELITQSMNQINFNEGGWNITSIFSSESSIPVRNVFKYKGTIIRLEKHSALLTCDGV